MILVDNQSPLETIDELTAAEAAATADVLADDDERDALAELDVEAMIADALLAESAGAPGQGPPVAVEDARAAEDAEALAFGAVVEEMIAGFSTLDIVDQTEVSAPEAVPADAADLEELGLGDAMDREAELAMQGLDYEPLEVGDDLYPGEAFVLNREADGFDEPIATPVAEANRDIPSGNQLGTAVRLTRDAVYAWMNLLQSPAIMTLPHE